MWLNITWYSLVALIQFRFATSQVLNNVCNSDKGYDDLLYNKGCSNNPDVHSDTATLIRRNGYPVETHRVVTEDGYILTVFRIPHNNIDTEVRRQPVFIQHGIAANSGTWLDKGNRSLAFHLVDRGYDVWLANSRGNHYSQSHIRIDSDISNYQFWSFSLYQMAIFDLSAEIKLVAHHTGSRGDIIYIGHSMGTTLSYMYAVVRKEEAEKYLCGLIAFAPVVFLTNSPAASQLVPMAPLLKRMLDSFKIYGVFTRFPEQNRLIVNGVTSSFMGVQAGRFFIDQTFGKDPKQISADDVPLFYSYWPDGVSVNLLLNFATIYELKAPVAFDYGELYNLHLYGSSVPPVFNFSNIQIPIHLFYGGNDLVADERDVMNFYNMLETKQKSVTKISPDNSAPFNHVNFFYAKDIISLLYAPLRKVLQTLSPATSNYF